MTMQERIVKELREWVPYICIALVLSFAITRFVGQRTKVDGESMQNTLYNADQLITDKISYRFTEPERFNIVVFPNPQNTKEHYIKRIIGLPNETIRIADGNIYINEELLEENYGRAAIINPGMAGESITLGDDEYFVMGDNRNNSTDSRSERVGPIKRENLIGKAWVRIYPFERMGVLSHE